MTHGGHPEVGSARRVAIQPEDTRTNRFGRLPRARASTALVLIVAIIALGLILPLPPSPKLRVGARTDLVFYGLVIDRMRRGEPYNRAAVTELRSENEPVRPFLTVRPPLLAELMARLPDRAARDDLMSLLSLAVIGAWTWRLRKDHASALWIGAVALVMFTSVAATISQGGWSLIHETWAGLLIALSLAARTEKRFVGSVALGLLAALIRELSLPYLAVMSAVAFHEKRRLEALAFALALATALAALALHARAVTALTNPADLGSPSWLTMSGWGLVMSEMQWNLVTLAFARWTAALILPLAIAGAIGRRDALGVRLVVLLVGYTLGFMVIGRPGNINWGLMISPLVGVGLCFAPSAIIALLRQGFAPNAKVKS